MLTDVQEVFEGALKNAELEDHFEALEVAIGFAGKSSLDVNEVVRDLHRRISKRLLPPKESGEYRTFPVYIGMDKCPAYYNISAYMTRLQEMFDKLVDHKSAWELHDEFECIHPFSDCNGRTGRLLLNIARLRLSYPLEIVTYGEDGDQFKYYKRITQYRDAKFYRLGENGKTSSGAWT